MLSRLAEAHESGAGDAGGGDAAGSGGGGGRGGPSVSAAGKVKPELQFDLAA